MLFVRVNGKRNYGYFKHFHGNMAIKIQGKWKDDNIASCTRRGYRTLASRTGKTFFGVKSKYQIVLRGVPIQQSRLILVVFILEDEWSVLVRECLSRIGKRIKLFSIVFYSDTNVILENHWVAPHNGVYIQMVVAELSFALWQPWMNV